MGGVRDGGGKGYEVHSSRLAHGIDRITTIGSTLDGGPTGPLRMRRLPASEGGETLPSIGAEVHAVAQRAPRGAERYDGMDLQGMPSTEGGGQGEAGHFPELQAAR